jgi:hypothetical protein
MPIKFVSREELGLPLRFARNGGMLHSWLIPDEVIWRASMNYAIFTLFIALAIILTCPYRPRTGKFLALLSRIKSLELMARRKRFAKAVLPRDQRDLLAAYYG